jgi:hypothetical protein
MTPRPMRDPCCKDLEYLRDMLQMRIRILVGDGVTVHSNTRIRLEVLRSILSELDTLEERRTGQQY